MASKKYKPNYKVSPMATIEKMSAVRLFGQQLYDDFNKRITEKNVLYLEAMFGVPRKFWLKLQANCEEK